MARLPGDGAALPLSRVHAVDPPWGSELLRFDRGRESRRKNLARSSGYARILGMAAVGLLLAAACGNSGGGNGQSQTLATDQTLKFPIGDDFGTLDPAQANSETDQEVAQNMFNGVLRFDKNLNIVPDIAASMPTVSGDGLTYTFKLRPDVTFWNGDKVTSKDVVYSWNRAAAQQGAYSTNFSAVAGFDKLSTKPPPVATIEQLLAKNDPSVMMSGLSAPDDTTVIAKLAQPAGWFLSAITLSASTGMVVDQKVVSKDPTNWWTNPATAVGTGAYKMSARTPGQSVDFQAVSNWWGSTKPTVKNVHLDIIKDASTRQTGYEQGKYDLNGFGGYSNLNVDDILRVKNTASLSKQLLLHPKVRTTWVNMNMVSDGSRTAKGPFVDTPGSTSGKDLRMAFALAIDKQKLAQTVCQGLVCTAATGGLITKGLKGYQGDNSDPLAKFDPTKAKSLLKSADPDGSKTKGLTYIYDPENPLNKAVAENIQDQWNTNLGVQISVQAESHSQFIKDYLSGKFVMNRSGWQADYDHPQDWFDNLFGKIAGCPDSNCASGFDSPQYDQLLASADSKPLADALPIYKQLSQMLQDNVAYIPLYYSNGAFMIKPYVKGAGTNNFFDIWWNEYQILQH
jgi:ABC-type oligopeptide transport system substrate-binding subunit